MPPAAERCVTADGPSTVQLVRAVAADAEALSALAGVIWRPHYADIISPAQIEYMLRQRYEPALIRAQIARGIAWDKLLVDGRIIAYASYFPDDNAREMKLDKLYVHPDHQRCGYGGLLISRALGAARRAGCTTLTLAVNKANARAIAAYAKYGFRIRDSVVQEIGGGFVMDDYIMVKDV
jgi:GNAT superfamily N-acetyltransferase